MRLTIERMANSGEGISHTDENKVIFVAGAQVGATVEAEPYKEKSNALWARCRAVIDPGPFYHSYGYANDEIESGFCWAALAYAEQLVQKRLILIDAMTRIGHFSQQEIEAMVDQVHPSPQLKRYRNKIELNYINNKLCMWSNLAESFIPVERLHAFSGPKEAIHHATGSLNYLKESLKTPPYRVEMRYSDRTNNFEIALWTRTGPFSRKLARDVLTAGTALSSLVRVQTKDTHKARRVVNVERLSGKGNWTENLTGAQYTVSAPSFFQVNTDVAEHMIDFVLGELKSNGIQTLLDLYSGVGTFGITAAKRGFHVSMIEAEGTSLQDARKNAQRACVQPQILGGDVLKVLKQHQENTRNDAAIVDPPRSGIKRACIPLIAHFKKLMYVSCNPATLARDLQLLSTHYIIERIHPVDLFPHTPHIESIAVLKQRASC